MTNEHASSEIIRGDGEAAHSAVEQIALQETTKVVMGSCMVPVAC